MEVPKRKELELRSEEVQEILTRVPNWMIRWGNIIIIFILLSIFLISSIIKYPDIVSAPIIITTNTPPEKLISVTTGKIEAILVKDKSIVKTGTPLAIIQNTANYKDVFLLKSILDTIDIRKSDFPFEKFKSFQLGSIEEAFSAFQRDYFTDKLNKKLDSYQIEKAAHGIEINELNQRLSLAESQKHITVTELEIVKSDLERYEALYKKGIISTQEIEKRRLESLQAQKNYKSILNNISSIKSQMNDLDLHTKTDDINETRDDENLQRNIFQSFYELKKSIKDWELNYVLRSSIDGKLSYLQLWAENQSISQGDNIFSIVPDNENGYVGKARAAAQNSGKIKVGQVVNISLANYPEREFGVLKGRVKAISLTPDKDGNLLIDISLPKWLQTSYGKKITFQQEMSGSADIVTNDLRLIERLLYQFRDIFRR